MGGLDLSAVFSTTLLYLHLCVETEQIKYYPTHMYAQQHRTFSYMH